MVWVVVLSFLECFDAVGLVRGEHTVPHARPLIPEGFLLAEN